MQQLTLLSDQPASRRTDNSASKAAEARQNASGRRASDQRKVLEAVKKYPGRTSKELAEIAGLERYMTARRLPDLLDAKLVTRLNGENGWRWW